MDFPRKVKSKGPFGFWWHGLDPATQNIIIGFCILLALVALANIVSRIDGPR